MRFANDFHSWLRHEWKLLANRLTRDPKIVIHVMRFANDFHSWLRHEWKLLANLLTRDPKSLFTVTHALFFISWLWYVPYKNKYVPYKNIDNHYMNQSRGCLMGVLKRERGHMTCEFRRWGSLEPSRLMNSFILYRVVPADDHLQLCYHEMKRYFVPQP